MDTSENSQGVKSALMLEMNNASSTSTEVGVRSLHNDMVDHWQVMESSIAANLSSDDEELDSTQLTAACMEGLTLNEDKEKDHMNVDDDKCDEMRQELSGASWLTTVGPIKNKDSDPTNLRRVVDYGSVLQVKEVSAKEELPKITLGEIRQKRQTLRQIVMPASRSLTTTASLPGSANQWNHHPTKTPSTSVVERGRTLIRDTGNRLFGRLGKPKRTYFVCQEKPGAFQDDTLSIHDGGEPATTLGATKANESGEQKGDDDEIKKGSKLRQLFCKVSQTTKGLDK